jgi:PIN domain nuclease of toxin-antitoxin system
MPGRTADQRISVLLDTHILIWWRGNAERVSALQAKLLLEMERRGEPVAISAITLRERAWMAVSGRLEVALSLDTWNRIDKIESNPLLDIIPIATDVAAESVRLGEGFPRDPANQIIVATARCHGLRLITADNRIRRWEKVALV